MNKSVNLLFILSIILTAQSNSQWTQTSGTDSVAIICMAVNGDTVIAGGYYGVIYRSFDNGINWTQVTTLPNANVGTGADVHALAIVDRKLFAASDSVYLSADKGLTWKTTALKNFAMNGTGVFSLASCGTSLFAGTNAGVFRSTDSGVSWSSANTGISGGVIFDFTTQGTNVFAATGNGVFISTDSGANWVQTNANVPKSVNALTVSGTTLFAGTHSGGVPQATGIFRSSNNGTNWTQISTQLSIDGSGHPKFTVHQNNIFVSVGYQSGVFLSTNNGSSWTAVNSGLADTSVYCLAVSGPNILSGTAKRGVWKRPLSQMITSVERLSNDLPTHFSLGQNFPNPFNPSTTIFFSIPSQSFVSLKVFDALGRLVANLVSEQLLAGKYSKNWNAVGLPSGVYFYRLQAGSFIDTKKQILLR